MNFNRNRNIFNCYDAEMQNNTTNSYDVTMSDSNYDLNMNYTTNNYETNMDYATNHGFKRKSLNYEAKMDNSENFEFKRKISNYQPNKRVSNCEIRKRASNCEISLKTFLNIVRNLPIKDKLNCRAVCKEWRNVIDTNIKIKYILFGNKYNLKINNKLTDQPNIVSENELNYHNFYTLAIKHPIFRSVKELLIHEFTLTNTFKILTMFNQINKLKIDHIEIKMNDIMNFKEITFNLSELVDFDLIYNYNIPIRIVCPKLKKIKLSFSENADARIQFPKSIEFAEFDIYNNCIYEFENLRELNCLDFVGLPLDLLGRLTKLTEIYTVQFDYFEKFKTQQFKFDRISDVNIYYFGVKLQPYRDNNTERKFPFNEEKIFKLTAEQLKFMIDQQLAPKLSFIESIAFDSLDPIFYNLPNEFLGKLTSLKELNILEIIEDDKFDDFLRFISKCSQNNLEFNNLVLRLHFLSHNALITVAKIIPFITNMQICDYIYRNDEALDYRPFKPSDFEFVFNFTKLTELTISKQIDCNFILRLFNELKDLVVLNIVLKRGDPFSITNYDNKKWVLTCTVRREEKNLFFKSLMDLIKYIQD